MESEREEKKYSEREYRQVGREGRGRKGEKESTINP